jgi:heme exporter protein C
MNSAPTMAATMLIGMLIMALGFWMYSIAAVLARVRCVILERERPTEWVMAEIGERG